LASFFSTVASRAFGAGRVASILATSFFMASLRGRAAASTSTMSRFPSSRTRWGTASLSVTFSVATGRSPDFACSPVTPSMTLRPLSAVFFFSSSGIIIRSKVITSVRADSRDAVYPVSFEVATRIFSLSAVLSKVIFSM